MPKKKIVPEQKLVVGPERIQKEALVLAMRRLMSNQDFILVRRLWLGIRGQIIEDGKDKPSEDKWAELRGFDKAIIVPEKWAATELSDHKNRQAEALQETINR